MDQLKLQILERIGIFRYFSFFGIDGIDQQSLERYRVGSNYKKIEKNFKSFIKAGGQATWQFIVFDHNEKYLEDAKRISTEEGFKNFRTIYSHRVGNNESKTKQRKRRKIYKL